MYVCHLAVRPCGSGCDPGQAGGGSGTTHPGVLCYITPSLRWGGEGRFSTVTGDEADRKKIRTNFWLGQKYFERKTPKTKSAPVVVIW